MLTTQQIAQLKHLLSPIRVECHRGTVRAGPNQQQVVCEGTLPSIDEDVKPNIYYSTKTT
jgi:hypothetical protein